MNKTIGTLFLMMLLAIFIPALSIMNRSAEGIGKTTSEMKQRKTCGEDGDFENIWKIDEGQSYPYLA